MKSPHGFTLIEVLVVIFIIGVLSSAVIYTNRNPFQKRELRSFAFILKMQMQAARLQAIFQVKEIGIVFSEKHYEFMQFNMKSNEWQPLRLSDHFWRIYDIPKNLELKWQSSQPSMQPQVIFYPSSEVSPFQLTMTLSNGSAFETISSDLSGNIITAEKSDE